MIQALLLLIVVCCFSALLVLFSPGMLLEGTLLTLMALAGISAFKIQNDQRLTFLSKLQRQVLPDMSLYRKLLMEYEGFRHHQNLGESNTAFSQYKWDIHWLFMARCMAVKVKTLGKSRVACIIVGPDNEILSAGFVGIPRGLGDCLDDFRHRHEKPEKFKWNEHAERNAIDNAARLGIQLHGGTLYVTHPICSHCAASAISVGIKRIVVDGSTEFSPESEFSRDGEEYKLAIKKLHEAGIVINEVYTQITD